MPEFRFTLFLNQFFSDYRSTCKLFVSNEIHTISDLIKYICKRFDIDKKFHLMCNNVYLPDTEDIRVLKEDDVVWAILNQDDCNPLEHQLQPKTQEKRKHKKKKLNKSLNLTNHIVDASSNFQLNYNDCDLEQDNIVEDDNCTLKPKKKKKKKAHKEVESVTEVTEESTQILTQKSLPLKNVELNVNSPYSYINTFKAPRKKHVELMQISTVPRVVRTIHVQDIPSPTKLFEECNENMVTSSPIIEPTNKISIQQVITAKPLEYEHKQDNVLESVMPQLIEQSIHDKTNIVEANENYNKESKSTTKSFAREQHASKLEQAKITLLQQIREKFENFSSNNIKQMYLPESHNSEIDDQESLLENKPCKKRKRKRTRRSKKSELQICSDSEIIKTSHREIPVVISPSHSVATHMRFDDEFLATDSVSENTNGILHSDNDIENVVDEQQCSSLIIFGGKERLQTADIENYPLVGDKLLKNGDIIAFKMLVMSESYTPEVSNYIIGHILNYNPTVGNLSVKVLEGHKYCYPPQGKFLMESSDNVVEEINEYALYRNQILEPRLLYP